MEFFSIKGYKTDLVYIEIALWFQILKFLFLFPILCSLFLKVEYEYSELNAK